MWQVLYVFVYLFFLVGVIVDIIVGVWILILDDLFNIKIF